MCCCCCCCCCCCSLFVVRCSLFLDFFLIAPGGPSKNILWPQGPWSTTWGVAPLMCPLLENRGASCCFFRGFSGFGKLWYFGVCTRKGRILCSWHTTFFKCCVGKGCGFNRLLQYVFFHLHLRNRQDYHICEFPECISMYYMNML